jgi:branched-chain amino acid transport system permease protein
VNQPALIDLDQMGSLLLNGLSYGALIFFLASGLTIIFGLMNIANLAHGGLYLLGGLFGLATMDATGNFLLAIGAGAMAAALLGLVIELGLLRRVRGQELPEVLMTLGIALIISDVATSVWGTRATTMPRPDWLSGEADLGPISYSRYHLFVIGGAVGVGLLLHVIHRRTRAGALIRAGVDNREMVAALGVDINRVFTGTFIFGAMLAGMGGVIGGGVLGLVPGEEMQILLLALVVIIVGGVGSLPGAALGSVLVGLLTSFGRVYFPELSFFILFAPMALVLMLRPSGLLGRPA